MKIAPKVFSICDWTRDGSKAVIFQNYFFSIFQNCSITNADGNYIFTKWCFGLKFNFPVLFVIGNFGTYFSRYALSGHTFSLLSFLTILQFYEKYLNSLDGKEYVRRTFECISTLTRGKPFVIILVRMGNCYIVVRRENAGRKRYQDAIQLLQRQHKESSRLQTVPSPSLLEVLQKASNPFHTSL